jgi:hypothetical protein
VRRLSARIIDAHGADPDGTLPELLATAISAVRGDHGGQCDLDHPGTPAAAVCMLRIGANRVDYLVLCDTTLVLDCAGMVAVITDERFGKAIKDIRARALVAGAIGTADHGARAHQAAMERQQLTNKPGGYWIAAANPDAAHQAITGSADQTGPGRILRAALLTDGAAAAVEPFGLMNWEGLLDLLTNRGPDELIRRVRVAESADRTGHSRPRYKRHDDATAALCLLKRVTP